MTSGATVAAPPATGPSGTEARSGAVGEDGRTLRVLHLLIMLGETNGQYNEHCLPLIGSRDLSICTYFVPALDAPAGLRVFAGDDTLRGFFGALGRALDANEYDVVHAHAPHTGALVTLALATRPRRWHLFRRLVFTVQDSYQDYKPRNKLLTLLGLALARRAVFCGRAAYESYPAAWRRLVGRRMRVIQNAADLDRVATALQGCRRRPDDGVLDIVSIGRLERVKDPAALVSAARRLPSDRSRLTIVGAGSLRGALEDAITTGQLGDRVTLTGLIPRDEVFRRCAAADLFVSASHGEGLPVAVIEAMATGLPVVLSDIPPHRELVDGADYVPFVRPGDVGGFVREIQRFIDMPPDDRRAIGERCRELVHARYGLPAMHRAYERVYRELA